MPDPSDTSVPSLEEDTNSKKKKKKKNISVALGDKPLRKAIDIIPFELSFTGYPKNGAVFWRSNDDVVEDNNQFNCSQEDKQMIVKEQSKVIKQDSSPSSDMQDSSLPTEAKAYVKGFLDKMSPYKDQFDPEVWEELEELAKSIDPREILKSLDAFDDPKVKTLVSHLTKGVEFISKQLEENQKRLEQELKEKEQAQKEMLKKSCDDFIKEISFIPMEKSQLSAFLYDMTEQMGAEKANFFKDMLKTIQESIVKAEDPTKPKGKTTDPNKAAVTKAEEFEGYLKEAINKSNDKSFNTIRSIVRNIAKEYPDLYTEYQKAVDNKVLKSIFSQFNLGGAH